LSDKAKAVMKESNHLDKPYQPTPAVINPPKPVSTFTEYKPEVIIPPKQPQYQPIIQA
jgi:hypothetical protein